MMHNRLIIGGRHDFGALAVQFKFLDALIRMKIVKALLDFQRMYVGVGNSIIPISLPRDYDHKEKGVQ